MRFRYATSAALAVVVIAAAVSLAGCSKEEPKVTSKWPRADAERSIEQPPEPPRWPLTGLEAPDTSATLQRVVSVKVENSPAARPQSGLDEADVVYESLTEGGITRFNALYHSSLPKVVAPVRSARMSDLYIVPQYDAIFAYSGANRDVLRRIQSSGICDMEFGPNPVAYYRGAGRTAPHNLFLDIEKVRRLAIEKGRCEETAKIEAFSFSKSVEETAAADAVRVPFSRQHRVDWTYDADTDSYVRANNGKPHTDADSGERLAATNVVVMWAKTKPLNRRDVTGSPTLDIELVGEGKCSVFRNGRRIDGTWRADKDSPPEFRKSDGTLIKFAPGNTWIEVVRTSTNITLG